IVSVRLKEEKDIERFLNLLEAGDTAAIKSNFGSKVVSIVDGQHREGGLIHAWEEDNEFVPDIPVMMYFGLSFIEEAELFNTINVTQRKLPKALIETTRGDIIEAGDSSYAQKIRRITFSLCRDSDSVWGPVAGVEQINMTGVRDPNRLVTYEGLRRSTTNMFPPTMLSRLEAIDEGLPMKYAKRYWRTISEACKEAWTGNPSTREETDQLTGEQHTVKILYRIKDLVGVASLAKLGKDIMTSDLESKEPKKLEELTAKLVEVDWEKRDDNPWMRSQAGFAGQKDLYELLHRLVYNDERPGELATEVPVMEKAA
ncbi:MAG: DNA sulfur modification protein DndB, partial [Gammaproteobacteria bacterium]